MNQTLTPSVIAEIEERLTRIWGIKARRRSHAQKIHTRMGGPPNAEDVSNTWSIRPRVRKHLQRNR